MKELLLKLCRGVNKTDVSKKEQEFVNELLRLHAVKLKKNFYKLDSNYRFGTIDISRNATGYLESMCQKSKDLLIEPKNLGGASKNDIVVAKRIFRGGGRPKAKVIYIVQKEYPVSVVYTKELNGKILGIDIKTAIPVTITASQKSLKKLPSSTVLKLDSLTNTVLEVLGTLDDPKVDEKISLAIFNKTEFFSKEAELEANSHGNEVDKNLYPNRFDLTRLPFCTIDPPDAKDFDDAIYFDTAENTLYVAIADVSEYLFPMGHIDKEAKARGFSIYFPHKSIPMLPRSLSENICSLKPNVDRLAFTYKIKIDPSSLKILNEELMESVIRSKRRFTYDEIDGVLEERKEKRKVKSEDSLQSHSSSLPSELHWLLPLNDLIRRVRKKRLEKGYEFSSSEIRMRVDEDQNLISTKEEKETASHALIEDCMLLANKAAAKRFKYGIFRTHESPSIDDIQNLLDDLASLGIFVNFSADIHSLIREIQTKAKEVDMLKYIDKLIIRAQKQARYTAYNSGHFGLGFKEYTHFTSPIRRYSDLTLHRLLKNIMRGDEKQKEFTLKNIEPLCEQISDLERESDKVAYDYIDRKYARWAKGRIGESFKCVITHTKRTPIAVMDDQICGVRIFLLNEEAELFEKVTVKIIDSDIATTKIIGKIVERS